MSLIKCNCGKEFLGQEDKEDTCPDCLKKLINPQEKYKTENKRMKNEIVIKKLKEINDDIDFILLRANNLNINADEMINEAKYKLTYAIEELK